MVFIIHIKFVILILVVTKIQNFLLVSCFYLFPSQGFNAWRRSWFWFISFNFEKETRYKVSVWGRDGVGDSFGFEIVRPDVNSDWRHRILKKIEQPVKIIVDCGLWILSWIFMCLFHVSVAGSVCCELLGADGFVSPKRRITGTQVLETNQNVICSL